ncbi:alpha/beta fold hydrolase [Paenibacillus humicola]|uniref:alpha/beta fold hydrolase n=1 Tax=Paenibacillus humicola TaxID=3110540 RepID=UPI00237BCF61|nr:alpha/beta fold hydrolase [Paenibacillus humicola]
MHDGENRDIGGVPCIVMEPAAEPAGHVMLFHGWGSTMESYRFFASLIASWGYRVIVPELPLHGARGSIDYADAAALQAHFWPVVRQGIREAGAIVSELTAESSVAVVGHSAGGFITAGAFAQYERVHAAAVINGSCAWVKFEEQYREKLGLPPMEAGDRDVLSREDPLSRIRLNPPKPLLLLHGQEDTTVPIDSQRYFMDEMSGASEHVQFVEYSGVNHHITLGMLQRIHAFLGISLPRGLQG